MPTLEKRTAPTAADPRETRTAGHVLVADGEATSREPLVSELRSAGFRVSIARTGFEAIV